MDLDKNLLRDFYFIYHFLTVFAVALKDYHHLDSQTAMSIHHLTPGSTLNMFWPISSIQ